MDQGLISLNVDMMSRDVTCIYENDAPYIVKDIIDYVEDMTEGATTHIMIYEGETLMHDLARLKDGWVDAKVKHAV